TFALVHEGGSAGLRDATRVIDRILAGKCVTQYWLVSYPRLDANGTTVTRGVKPDDDLWLNYDIWAAANDAGTIRRADVTKTVYMRNEISAAANKIWPNGDNKVPDIYKTAIAQAAGWATFTPSGSNAAYPGELVTTQGIWYDLGNVGAGFDNNGDLVPDKNAWLQPIGDPNSYDPGCFRLVHTYGIVIVKLKTGGEYLIPFVDQMYFENIPDNTGAVGLVFYQYATLNGACTAGLSPYQEVASGFDNEKFSGDYGVSIPPLVSQQPKLAMSKLVDQSLVGPSLPATLKYTLQITNTGPITVGLPLVGMPLVMQDRIPSGTIYVASSAASANVLPSGVSGYTILYSTDSGASWTSVEPPAASVTNIQWRLKDALPPGVTGSVSFRVQVPSGYTPVSVPNT